MPTLQGRVVTDRAGRYLDQLCGHLGHMRHMRHGPIGRHGGAGMPKVEDVERSGAQGTIRFADGTWTLTATPDALLLRVDAADEQALLRLQESMTARVEKIGRRDRLSVAWQRVEASGADPVDSSGRIP